MKHLLLEVYCDCKLEIPSYCLNDLNSTYRPGSHCFENNCKYLSYTDCPNEIAYAGELGIIETLEDFIGFGGEMEPNSNDVEKREFLLTKWRDICRKKISEAHEEYMAFKNRL